MSSPISGFTAIPNPQMLAFMPIQSYLMMYFAGAGWQIGKRKISAIPNDKFNPMSAKDLLEGFTADLRESIPVLERSLKDITPLIRILIEQYGDFVREALAAVPQAVSNIFSGGVSTEGGRQVISRSPVGGSSKGTQFGFLGYAEQQLMQQYILDQQKRAGTSQNIRDKSTVLNPLQRAANRKQEQFLRQNELKRLAGIRGRIELRKTKQPTPVGVKWRKVAGQSQKMERLRLIRLIKLYTDTKLSLTTHSPHQVKKNAGKIRAWQQLLVNLLARYKF